MFQSNKRSFFENIMWEGNFFLMDGLDKLDTRYWMLDTG
jgi:hypothetical protein